MLGRMLPGGGVAKAVGEIAVSCWPTLTAAGTQQPGKEGLGSLSSFLGTTYLLSGKRLLDWLQVGWEGVAQWLSAQGFGGRQSWARILPVRCSGSRLELQWYTARRTWC